MKNIRPKVLFVCIGNYCRSQMAEGFAKSLVNNKIEIFSAGTRPMGSVNPQAIDAMREAGIDISNQRSKGVRQIPQERYDVIVTMGCGDACQHIPTARRIDWQIPDPLGGSNEYFASVRNQIRDQVEKLLKEMLETLKTNQ